VLRLVFRNFRATLDRGGLFWQFIFPIFFIYIQGFALSPLIPNFAFGAEKVSYLVYAAAGISVFSVINSGFWNAGTLPWRDRRQGMFEQILLAPYSRSHYIASVILTTVIIVLASAGFVFLFGLPILLSTNVSITPLGTVLMAGALVLGSIFFGSLGIMISLRARSEESFFALTQVLFFLIMFPSSMFYPAELVPGILRYVFYANPATYTADMFRSGVLGAASNFLPYEIIALAILSMIAFFLAIRAFRKIKL